MYCSIHQAVEIWDDLRDAMEGKHGFGGHTAEIYAYRLMPNMPRLNIPVEKIEMVEKIRAAKSLVAIIDMFRERYINAIFLIEGLDYHSWCEKYGHTFDHRVKVEYIKR